MKGPTFFLNRALFRLNLALLKAYYVPHLMCRRTEGISITARRCCGVFRNSGAGYKTADLLTYLLTYLLTQTVMVPATYRAYHSCGLKLNLTQCRSGGCSEGATSWPAGQRASRSLCALTWLLTRWNYSQRSLTSSRTSQPFVFVVVERHLCAAAAADR